MKKFLALLLIPVLVACSNGGGFSANEQSFIAGNGVATFIPKADRKAAPSISGPTLDGSTFTATLGKVLVLNVWASWCSPCRAEAPALQELSAAHPEVQFLGGRRRSSSARTASAAPAPVSQAPSPESSFDPIVLVPVITDAFEAHS